MPNNPRQQIKKDLERAINHVEWIQQILMATAEKYREHHPEIVKQYEATFAFFEQGKAIIEGLRDSY